MKTKIKNINVNLDEAGFVFIDDANCPYWCCLYHGDPWLFYWHADKKWVTLRKCSKEEIESLHEKALPVEKANIYHTIAGEKHDLF